MIFAAAILNTSDDWCRGDGETAFGTTANEAEIAAGVAAGDTMLGTGWSASRGPHVGAAPCR